jgi:hypothetical protein
MRKKSPMMLVWVFLLTIVSFVLTLPAYGSNMQSVGEGKRGRNQHSNSLAHPKQPHVLQAVEQRGSVQLQVLVYTDDTYLDPSERYPIVALDSLEMSYLHYADDYDGFHTALLSQTWDLVVVSHNNYYEFGDNWTELEQYVLGGGRLVLTTFDIDGSDSEPTTLWATLGAEYRADMSVPEPVYRWEPAHPIFTSPNTIGDLTLFTEGYPDDGDHVAVITGTALAGFTPTPTPDYASIVEGNGGKTVLMSFLLCEFRSDEDTDGKLDAVELWENAITYVTGLRFALYAGGSDPGVVYEYLGGTSWQTISPELGYAVLCLCESDGYLYAGTMSDDAIGRVWRYDGDTTWTLVGDNMDNQVCALIVFRGNLYAGTAWGSGRLYRYDGGTTWTMVVDETSWDGFRSLYVWNNILYIGDIGMDYFGHYDGTTFTFDADLGGSCIWDFEVYDNSLYASAWYGRIHISTDGTTWTTIRDEQDYDSWELETFQGYLYLTTGPRLETYDGSNFSLVWTEPDQNEIISMINAGNALILGTGEEAGYGGSGPGVGRAYTYDGNQAELISSDMGSGIQALLGELGWSPCQVSPTSLHFGPVTVGTYVDKTFTITNTGGEMLAGTVSESCDHYSIVSGGGAYSLGTCESMVVTVRFEPASPGQHYCSIETGNDLCSHVSCTGLGDLYWYWKSTYQDYAPSGMPDIDQRQDDWIKMETGQFTFCGPCAVANCFKWFDSKYNEGLGGSPGDGMDAFPLVRDYLDQLPPFVGWDDHDPWNVNHTGTPWNPGMGAPPATDQPFLPGPQPQPSSMPPWGELVERLAWYFDTDGIQTGYCDHAGTDVLEMEQGIQDWLESEMFDDGSYLADTLCVAITARPTFTYVESLVEKSENVILLLGFWYLGQAPVQRQFQEFIRGDLNGSGTVGASDEIMCVSGGPFSCDDAADVNDDGILNLTDCAYLHDYLWSGGPPPPSPYPDCGLDPTSDTLDCGSSGACGQGWRVGGHYVTVAGVNSIEQKIALSDPFIDAAELGLAEGRVGDGWLIGHPYGSHDPTVHNDEGNVSHDMYAVVESDDPGGRWHLVDYAVSSDPYYWTENFFAQNVPEEFLAVTQQWDGVSPIFTEIEYCIHVSPWDYRGDVNHSGAVEAGDVVYLISYLYRGGPPPDPYVLGDVNCDGVVTAGDIVRLLNYLFRGWEAPRCCDP